MDVAIRPASAAERPLIEGLFQFYVYDFSEMSAGESKGWELGEDGRFAPYPHIEGYWRDEGRLPLLIEAGAASPASLW